MFALFNSEFAHRRSLAFAQMLTESHPELGDRLEAAFLRTYSRPPINSEVAVCREHYERLLSHHRKNSPQPLDLPARVERGMIEEFTGEMVRWDEELPLGDYERDVMPWEVSPEVRALAEVCLVLLNSNEFLYVR